MRLYIVSPGGTIETAIKDLSPLEAAKKFAPSLDHSILPIQGPPGSGKTFTGAHMVIQLLEAGKRVGITANRHSVISNLLSTLCEVASEINTKLTIIQKSEENEGCKHDFVSQTDDNGKVLEKRQSGEAKIGAGTTWLWSREEFVNSVDVLLVDEAGQMSLANVLAVSPAAKRVVLLRDPEQLDQPQKGVRPPGAEVSALAHLLNGRATIEPEQGLFSPNHGDCIPTSALLLRKSFTKHAWNRGLRTRNNVSTQTGRSTEPAFVSFPSTTRGKGATRQRKLR